MPSSDPRVADLLARLAAIEEALAAGGSAGGGDTNGVASPETLSAIEQRLATLEQTGTSSAAADELATLSERVTAIEQLLIDFMTEVPAESLADVKTEVQRLIDENKGLRAQLATLTHGSSRPIRLRSCWPSAGSARRSTRAGRSSRSWRRCRHWPHRSGAAAPKAGARYARDLCPDRRTEPDRLAGASPKSRAPSCRRRSRKARCGDDDAGWWDRLMGRVSELVTVRPVGEDVEGDSPAARVARAEAHIASGDLASAVNELDH